MVLLYTGYLCPSDVTNHKFRGVPGLFYKFFCVRFQLAKNSSDWVEFEVLTAVRNVGEHLPDYTALQPRRQQIWLFTLHRHAPVQTRSDTIVCRVLSSLYAGNLSLKESVNRLITIHGIILILSCWCPYVDVTCRVVLLVRIDSKMACTTSFLSIFCLRHCSLDQCFSTGGPRTPGGPQVVPKGFASWIYSTQKFIYFFIF
jgi:hypothetical protein